MEGLKQRIGNIINTGKNISKVVVATSALLLSSCKDNQIQDHSQSNIETTKDQAISYKPNIKELVINGDYIMHLIPNDDGTYLISSNKDQIDVDVKILQDYCDTNDMGDIIINENNKIEIIEAIFAMNIKDKLLEEGQEELGLYVFNTINQSKNQNILSAGPFDDSDYNETQSKIVIDSMKEKNNTLKNQDTVSIEDQYLLAEDKSKDTNLTQQERKKRSEKYNRLSTELLSGREE